MASTTVTLEKTQDKTSPWFGGKSPMNASYGKLMMWFFLLSDAFTFSAFLVGYGIIRFMHPAYNPAQHGEFKYSTEYWPIPEYVFNAFPGFHGVHMPLVFVGLMTFLLIVSSVTMVLAVEAGHRRDQQAVVKWMLWTILGGATFLACQAWEWTHFIMGDPESPYGAAGGFIGANLIQNQYGPTPFADFFFFITGFHGFHVFSGVLLNIWVFHNAAYGHYERLGHYEMVEKVGLYWHFVDLVWVFVFTFFYLI